MHIGEIIETIPSAGKGLVVVLVVEIIMNNDEQFRMHVFKERGHLRGHRLNLYRHRILCSNREVMTQINNKEFKCGQKQSIHTKYTSSCVISQTRLRSAIDGWFPPSKKRPLPFSQMDSIFDKDEEINFSASAAASGFNGRPRAGARVVCRTYATTKARHQIQKPYLTRGKGH